MVKEKSTSKGLINEARHGLNLMPNVWFITMIVIFIALTGTIGISLNNPLEIGPDGTGYFNYAVNIKNLGIYSFKANPTENNFLREPGYSYYLAAILSIWHGINKPDYIENYDLAAKQIGDFRADLVFVRYSQLFLLLITIIVFYHYLLLITTRFLARISAIVCSVYYPLIVYSVQIIREPLLLLLFTLYVFLLTLYFKKNRKLMLAFSSIIVALMSLTFQVMIVFTPISLFLIMIAPGNRKFFLKIRDTLLFFVVTILSLMPWICKVYKYYPDIRVAKTVGCALTHESLTYVNSVRAASKRGVISPEELSVIEHDDWYRLGSKEIFERSFNGWYLEKANQWRNKGPAPQPQKFRKLKRYWSHYYLNWIKHGWSPLNFQNRDSFSAVMYVPFILSVFIGIISTIGTIIYLFRERFFLVLPYLFFMFGVICYFGGDKRRSLPMMPLLLFLFAYCISFILNTLVKLGQTKDKI